MSQVIVVNYTYNTTIMCSMLTILIVDDDADDVLFLNEAFDDSGTSVNVSFRQNTDSTFEYLNRLGDHHLPDVIISDLNMPGRNGIDLIRLLKASERYRDIPIFILSSSTRPRDRENCIAAGAHDYLVKPLHVSQLAGIVNRIITCFTTPSADVIS